MEDETAPLSAADEALLASMEPAPEVQLLWEARGDAARAHDWPRFWQTYIDTSQQRTDALVSMRGYNFLLEQEEQFRATYIERRIATAQGLWPEPGEGLPRGYVYDPNCKCDVCKTLRRREEQP